MNSGPLMSQRTIGGAMLEDIMRENTGLILQALEDAMAWREENGSDEDIQAYADLVEQLEEWQGT